MKTNRALIGISAAAKAKGATCRLRPECTALYADYFVKFIQAYQAAGIAIYGVTLQNEPQFDAAAYPCMRMDEDDQIRLVRALGPKLAANHLATRIFVHDHNWVLHPNDRQVVGGDAKLQPVDSVAKIMGDPEAGKYIAGSAWHCYTGGAGDMKRVYDATHARFPRGQILTTELSGWGRDRGNWWGDHAEPGADHAQPRRRGPSPPPPGNAPWRPAAGERRVESCRTGARVPAPAHGFAPPVAGPYAAICWHDENACSGASPLAGRPATRTAMAVVGWVRVQVKRAPSCRLPGLAAVVAG